MIYDLLVIGGGAGGCFGAIRLAELKKEAKILVLEAGRKPLGKVEISGGGRCNVTHACFDPEVLINYYPRGGDELLQPFKIFQPRDMISWLAAHGVKTKREEDGRMFPVTDTSATIISTLLSRLNKLNIELRTSMRVEHWVKLEHENLFEVKLQNGQSFRSKNLLISTGSDQRTWNELKKCGHHIIEPVPSLFTFTIRDKQLTALQGISRAAVQLHLSPFRLSAEGPLLITHWGLSGPAVLKLSAWGARELHQAGYTFDLVINWVAKADAEVRQMIQQQCLQHTRKQVMNLSLLDIPSRLWKYLCSKADITTLMNCSELGKTQLDKLVGTLTNDHYHVTGKNTFKEEFVTAGGVDLQEMDFTRFESRIVPGLYLVGEVLNIDALTGGFNFQAAWTGAEVAARAIAESMRQSA